MALKKAKKTGLIVWCAITALFILANVFEIDLASLFFLLFGLATAWIVLNSFKFRLKIKNTPTSKIKTAESKSELVEIKASNSLSQILRGFSAVVESKAKEFKA